jgi:hypothetical protein
MHHAHSEFGFDRMSWLQGVTVSSGRLTTQCGCWPRDDRLADDDNTGGGVLEGVVEVVSTALSLDIS